MSRSQSFEWFVKFRSGAMSITVHFSHKITAVEIHAIVPMVCVSMIILFSNVIAFVLSQGVLNALYCSLYLDKHKCGAIICSNAYILLARITRTRNEPYKRPGRHYSAHTQKGE